MALPKGTKRYQHKVTGEVRYFIEPLTPPSGIKLAQVLGTGDGLIIGIEVCV